MANIQFSELKSVGSENFLNRLSDREMEVVIGGKNYCPPPPCKPYFPPPCMPKIDLCLPKYCW